MHEHDFEPEPGLPEALPQGEHILWQGKPGLKSLLNGTFHVRKLALYFAALATVHFIVQLRSGTPLAEGLGNLVTYTVLAVIVFGMLAIYARQVARTTMYTITNRRVVMRCGVAVPVTLNLPYSRIDSAGLREHRDGSGDIALIPEMGSRVSYILLWPHLKPGQLLRVTPVLRGVDDAATVAHTLSTALADELIEERARAARTVEQPEPVAEPDDEAAPPRFRPYPTIPLAAAGALIVFTVLSVALLRLMDSGDADAPPLDVVASVELRFEDRADGSVEVVNAADDSVIDVLEPGSNGFVRATLRGLVRTRRAAGIGAEPPFSVTRTRDGRLLLIDAATSTEIDLWAFGPTNAMAFGSFLPATSAETQQEPAAETADTTEADVTTIALTNKETRP